MDRDQGFTLLEIIFAFSILTIALFGILSAMSSAFLLSRYGEILTETHEVAQAVLDESVETGYDNLMNLDGNSVQQDGYTIAISVTQEDINLRSVLVSTTKDGEAGTEIDLIAYVSDR